MVSILRVRAHPIVALSYMLLGCGGDAVSSSSTADEPAGDSSAVLDGPAELRESAQAEQEPGILVGSPVPTYCSCVDADYFIELHLPNQVLRFTGPPRSLWGECETYTQPSFYRGGSCRQTAISACDASGQCVTATEDRLEVVTEAGLSFSVEAASRDIAPFLVAESILANSDEGAHSPILGEFFIDGAGVTVVSTGDASDLLPIEGRFSLCLSGADLCLK